MRVEGISTAHGVIKDYPIYVTQYAGAALEWHQSNGYDECIFNPSHRS